MPATIHLLATFIARPGALTAPPPRRTLLRQWAVIIRLTAARTTASNQVSRTAGFATNTRVRASWGVTRNLTTPNILENAVAVLLLSGRARQRQACRWAAS